jgi:hypothetical protein
MRVATRKTETGNRYDLIDAVAPKGKVNKRRITPKGYVCVDIHLAKRLFDQQIEFTIAGNNINSFHIFNGWYLGYTPSLEAMTEQTFDALLNNWIFYLDPELGSYPVFYVSKENLAKLV